jgi:hypothetical protein
MKKILFLVLATLILNNIVFAFPEKVFPNRPNRPNRQNHQTYNKYKQNHPTGPIITKHSAYHSTTPLAQKLRKMNRSQSLNKDFMCHHVGSIEKCIPINYFPRNN